MEIIYTAQAKNDLTQIHWKTRNSLITYISQYKTRKSLQKNEMRLIHDTDFYKLDFSDYIAVSKLENNSLSILTVIEKKKIRVPE